MAKNPLISVIIPTYNQALYLGKTLDSVLSQLYFPFEIIVVDDGSTDQTKQILKSYSQAHSSIHWVSQSNQGPSCARNHAVALSQGNYLALLDADDLMDSQRLALQYQALQENPSKAGVYTALTLIDSKGKKIKEIHSQPYLPQDLKALMLFRNVIPAHSTLLLKKECFSNNLYDETYRHAEDYEFMLRLVEHHELLYLDLPLTCYRRHENNLSNNLTAHQSATLTLLQRYSSQEIEDRIEKTSFTFENQLLLKGKIFYNQQAFEAALEIFLHLSHPLALFYAGNCYFKSSLFMQAAQAYENALSEDSANAACWNNLGIVYHHLKQDLKGQKCFKKALVLQPAYLDALFNQTPELLTKEMKMTEKELRSSLIPYSFS